ncbi:hypothetical protein CPB83DRAFT_858856 [Crepidotus variabilis]|uniref:Uncharacterized protein n=1 Tax=Crepidotus variabilis TaxID=179855 RepID=A0A9P6JLZ3_9AGAR|nr:hypothetical protein CPB83DRAFT_858856 [Crepidotus variabilis]
MTKMSSMSSIHDTAAKHSQHLERSNSQRTSKPKHDANEREVTDPITHLPLIIHDSNNLELEQIPWLTSVPDAVLPASRQSSIDSLSSSASGVRVKHQSDSQRTHQAFENTVDSSTKDTWIPDPTGDARRTRLQTSLVSGVAAAVGLLMGSAGWESIAYTLGGRGRWFGWLILPLACLIFGFAVGSAGMVFGAGWKVPEQHMNRSAQSTQSGDDHEDSALEQPQWLNNLIQSLWPIINPSLFTSMSDMLEDAMQATLPSLINGVRVADLGQGSEPVHILSIQMLPKARAASDVDGLKAEEGDFINLQLALGYRTAKSTKTTGMKHRSKNIHLLMEFYTTGGLTIPVFVDLTSLMALMRVRVQLTPNPPFLSILTLSLMGQPHVSMNCTPLSRHLLNVMDIPGLSGWLKSSIELAVSAYVAPRSLTLDLKELLAGREAMDVQAKGVVFIRIRRAREVGDGDALSAKGIVDGKKARRGDAYISVAWKKWGRALWSTRVISGTKNPIWEESCTLIVGKEEVDAGESVRVQVWDSDKYTADDLLGNIDVPLKELMDTPNPSSLSSRTDGLKDDKGHDRPGSLSWEIGYFKKTTLEQQFESQGKSVRDADRWREDVEKEAEGKLREAMPEEDGHASDIAANMAAALSATLGYGAKDPPNGNGNSEEVGHGSDIAAKMAVAVRAAMGYGSTDQPSKNQHQHQHDASQTMNAGTTFKHDTSAKDQDPDADNDAHESEIAQQKAEDLKEKTDELISSSSPPSEKWPSGVLSITIESISGLEVEKVRETGVNPQNDPEEQEGDAGVDGGKGGEDGDLPSSYCVIVLNHEKVYKTRVKMKSSNPFFNAITEKFITDLDTASLFISVRDSRMHENNPIIGVVSLPLPHIFSTHKSSMFTDSLPLVGGIGFGRMRVKLLWRSVQLSLPRELRGWGVGTLEVGKEGEGVRVARWYVEDVKKDWDGCRLEFRTTSGKGKGKMLPTSSRRTRAGTDDEGKNVKDTSDWVQKKGRALHLAVTKRYKGCVTLEVRKRAVGPDRTMAFGTFWLMDVKDDEEGVVSVDLWRATKSSSSSSDDATPEGVENHTSPTGLLSSLNPIANSSYGRTSSLMDYASSNVCRAEDMEQQDAEKVCTVDVPIKFWSGLSGYHQKMAAKDTSGNLKDVMEVLDYVQGEEEGKVGGEDGVDDSGSDSDSDDSSDSDDDGVDSRGAGPEAKDEKKGPVKVLSQTKDTIVDEAKSFKKHQHELQRKHRGLMQWKGARNVAWLGRQVEQKAERAVEKVKDKVQGNTTDPERGAGIEKEV